MNMTNSKGSKTLPWGTPESTSQYSDVKCKFSKSSTLNRSGAKPTVFQLFEQISVSLKGRCGKQNQKPS